jgi:nucleotide-binding universal stress UspA family protein
MRAYVSTLLVRAYQPQPEALGELQYRRILVPLDCSRRAECVLPLSTMLAEVHEADLLLAHVVQEIEIPCASPPHPEKMALVRQVITHNREMADEYLQRVSRRLPGRVKSRSIVAPDVTTALYDLMEKEQIDLMVMSAHGHAVNPKWPYGTLAVGLIVYGTAPLLIVQDLPVQHRAPTKAELAAQEFKGH